MKDNNTSVSGNKASNWGGGVHVYNIGVLRMAGGTVYGNTAPPSLANTGGNGAALYVESGIGGGVAEYGTFGPTDIWISEGDILATGYAATDATIRVVDGAKQ
jgi:hypothetical protein